MGRVEQRRVKRADMLFCALILTETQTNHIG